MRAAIFSFVLFGSTGASLFALTYLYRSTSLFEIFTEYRAFFALGAGVLGIAGLVVLMRRYLETRVPSISDTIILNAKAEHLQGELADVRAMLTSFADRQVSGQATLVQLNPADRDAFLSETTQAVLKKLTPHLMDNVQRTLKRQFDSTAVIDEAIQSFQRITRRLEAAVEEVRNRAQLNLILGAAGAATGLLFLFYFVLFYSPAQHEPWQETLVRSLPRLSVVLIIELIGYFFLGLYRFGTTELKYFQNEITNIELWATAYLHAMRRGDEILAAEIIKRLLAVERNFILKKGERAAFAPEAADEIGLTASDIKDLLAFLRKPKKQDKSE